MFIADDNSRYLMKVHLLSLHRDALVKQEFQWEKLIAEKFVNLEILGHMICCDLRSVKT